jgi:hypothetical protein
MLTRSVQITPVLVALLLSRSCVVAEVVLDQAQEQWNGAVCPGEPVPGNPMFTVWMGQTFTAQVNGTLSHIELHCRSFTTCDKTISLTATTYDAVREAYLPDLNQVLAATTASYLPTRDWYTFHLLSAGAEVQAGRTYAIVVQAQSDADDFEWFGCLSNVYPGGTYCRSAGTYWLPVAYDMTFRTWVQVSAEEQLLDLDDYIAAAIVDGGLVDPELEEPLLAKVDAAIAALQRGNPNDAKVAMNDLKALVNQVEAQSGNKIDPATAEGIIARANEIIAALEAAM